MLALYSEKQDSWLVLKNKHNQYLVVLIQVISFCSIVACRFCCRKKTSNAVMSVLCCSTLFVLGVFAFWSSSYVLVLHI